MLINSQNCIYHREFFSPLIMRIFFSGKFFDIDSYVHFTIRISSMVYSGSLSVIEFVGQVLRAQLQ